LGIPPEHWRQKCLSPKTSSFLRRNFSQKVKWEDNRTLIRLLNLSYMCWVAQRQEVSRRRPLCAWIQYLKSCGHRYLSSYWTTTTGTPLQQRIDALRNIHICVGEVYTNGFCMRGCRWRCKVLQQHIYMRW
jgi:hypothetical protein